MMELDLLLVIYATNYHPALVIGGGKVGQATARALKQKDIPVHLLERDETIRAKLSNIADRTFIGDAADREVLMKAGLGEAGPDGKFGNQPKDPESTTAQSLRHSATLVDLPGPLNQKNTCYECRLLAVVSADDLATVAKTPEEVSMLKKTGLLIAVLAAALKAAPVYAQDSKLVEAGKEGKVTVYGSLETDSAEAVFKIFRQKTGIDLEYWRASSTKVMDRALTEYRAGKPGFDVILTNDNPMQIMSREGIFANYESPSARIYQGIDRSQIGSPVPQRHDRDSL